MDNLTKEQRKRNMQNIKSKDTEIEVFPCSSLKASWVLISIPQFNVSPIINSKDIPFSFLSSYVLSSHDAMLGDACSDNTHNLLACKVRKGSINIGWTMLSEYRSDILYSSSITS